MPFLKEKFPIKNFIKFEYKEYGFLFDNKVDLVTFLYPAVKQPARGVVVWFHGLYSYSNRNVHVAKKFAEQGFDVAAFD